MATSMTIAPLRLPILRDLVLVRIGVFDGLLFHVFPFGPDVREQFSALDAATRRFELDAVRVLVIVQAPG